MIEFSQSNCKLNKNNSNAKNFEFLSSKAQKQLGVDEKNT